MSALAPVLVASGLAHQRGGRLQQAEHCYLAALRIDPANAEAQYCMGVLGLQSGNGDGALAYLARVIARRERDADALYNMGMAHVLSFRLREAERWFQKALDVDAAHTAAHFGLGNLDRLLGRSDAWPAHYRAGMRSPKATAEMASNALVALHSNASVALGELYALHREWEQRFAIAAYGRWRPHDNARVADRPLTIGLVSSSFHATIVGHFLRGVLRALASRDDAKIFLYANSTTRDWLSDELRASSERWMDITALDDDDAAARIRTDGIDILIDLNGHAPGHRLLVFARRPAPVQITWLDYFDTTGLAAIDYIISDPVSSPSDTAQCFVERLLYMPSVRLCFTPPPFTPEVASVPARHANHITFGSFTRADKIGPDVLALWGRILAALPHSKLILKGDTFRFPEVRERFVKGFGERGIDPSRVELRLASSHAQLLAEYADVDIALDPFPYNGGATTCDALWMGVPVVTRQGDSMISRQSAAMLAALAMPELVARDDDAYLAIATRLAASLARLETLRGSLRHIMAASPLCDAERFSDAFMQRMRQAWREWCEHEHSS